MNLLWVTLAGAAGCVARYLLEYAVRRHHPTIRPWATVFANAAGSGIAGWAAYRLAGAVDLELRTVILTGFCGGLTTFSSAFAIPALLAREHHWRYSVTLVVTTPLLCAGFFALGMTIAH
jgi:CrcB protein